MTRTPARLLTSLAFGATLFSAAWEASAQDDLEYAPPDVLLLVDTSGSMGLTTIRDPNNPSKYAAPQCGTYPESRPVDVFATEFTAAATPADRWSILVHVLTGSINGHACSSQPRTTTDFKEEFGLGGTSPTGSLQPYDTNYYMPFNRVVAKDADGNECTPAPSWATDLRDALEANAVKWPTDTPVYWRKKPLATSQPYGSNETCEFDAQDDDGLIDRYIRSIRFGLMTFDPSPAWVRATGKSVEPGVVPGDPLTPYYEGGIGDIWSYFPGWNKSPGEWGTAPSSTSYGMGWPDQCGETMNAFQEVGARNPAAPPWEGRLIDFGDPMADEETIARNNRRVKQALLAMRPYGGTPTAGLLRDAWHFLLNDDMELQDASGTYFWGGSVDDTVDTASQDGCRKRIVILITDGGPNLDLRPGCDTASGQCPYPETYDTAASIAAAGIDVYVIGFALATTNGAESCNSLVTDDTSCAVLPNCTSTCNTCAYGYCIDDPKPDTQADNETLAACCNLRTIAQAGGTEQAYYADNVGDLQSELSSILGDLEKGTRTRSQPVFSSGSSQYTGSSENDFQGAEFLNTFSSTPTQLMAGNLQRGRWKCMPPENNEPSKPELQDTDESLGDDFGVIMNLHRDERIVYSAVAEATDGQPIHSTRSIRPWHQADDGLGNVGVASETVTNTKMVTATAVNFASVLDPRAMQSGTTVCTTNCCLKTDTYSAPSASVCRTRYLRMLLGLSAQDSQIDLLRDSTLGAVIQAAPVLAGPPDDYLRDESYRAFQQLMKNRDVVLYAPTTDGQLHAFDVMRVDDELSELWTFIPPNVLPRIEDEFPDYFSAAQINLLDGPITVVDVPGQTTVTAQQGKFLQRRQADAEDPSQTRWYTILVGSYGSTSGYYALDVTWPNTKTDPPDGYTQGPRFLWQLTTDENGQPLFGSQTAAPAITTLFFEDPDETGGAAEHAVAILPGGYDGDRTDEIVSASVDNTTATRVDDRIEVRESTRRYEPVSTEENDIRALGGARSLTIVRLDTGEIVRTFRRSTDPDDKQAPDGLFGSESRVSAAPFDAPMVGRIIAYPNGAGAVSTRAFVGDAEGRLWRMDLSSVDPADWSVDLFHDAYPQSAELELAYTASDAQPIQTAPILSTDALGRLTIAISTGDQRTINPTGEHIVWSLTETLEGTEAKAKINWYLNKGNTTTDEVGPHFDNGERVMGPMSLFNSVLYFVTYDPSLQNEDTCRPGTSYRWGVHYLNTGTTADIGTTEDPRQGPQPALDIDADDNTTENGSSGDQLFRIETIAEETVAFGVGIVAKPACYITEDVPADPMLGYGTHSSITSVTPTQFQLVTQMSSKNDSEKITTDRKNLFPPLGGGRIDSWASLLE